MSTNNFKFENILIVLPDFKLDNRCLDEECEFFEVDLEGGEPKCEHVSNYYDFDTEGFNMWVSDMKSQLEKIGFEDWDSYDNNRNYNVLTIATWSIEDKNGNKKEIEVVIRNGYYDGANIDYFINNCDYSYIETQTMKKKIDSKIKQLEKVLRKNGTELLKVGQFNNGEAVYKLKK